MMRQFFQYCGEQFKFYSYHHAQYKLSKNKSLPVQRKNSKGNKGTSHYYMFIQHEKQAEKRTVGELMSMHGGLKTQVQQKIPTPFFLNKLMHIVKYL